MKLATLALLQPADTPTQHTQLAALACLPRAKKPVKTIETMLIQTTLYSSYARYSFKLHYMTHMKVFYKTVYKTT